MSQFNKILSITCLSVLILMTGGCASTPETPDPNVAMQEKYGIEILSVQLTSVNYMINFKYKVLDPEKAAPLHNRKIQPYIVLERTGSQFGVPLTEKLGSIRSSPKFAKAGKNYFIFFGNPARYIKAGDLITIVIGDFKVEHIEVK